LVSGGQVVCEVRREIKKGIEKADRTTETKRARCARAPAPSPRTPFVGYMDKAHPNEIHLFRNETTTGNENNQ